MRTGKKAQAILPFFAVQLVSMMIFMIVLLTLMTMTKNVKFTISEFDDRTAFLLASRRIVSSADCLAYEERGALYDQNSDYVYSGARVFPNLLDWSKINDYENLNCMRKDFLDKKSDVYSGYWDALNATGGTFKYTIRIVDLKTGLDVYDFAATDNSTTSLIGRVTKDESLADSKTSNWGDDCSDRYGGWHRTQECYDIDLLNMHDAKNCLDGRCHHDSQESWGVVGQSSGFKPYWNTSLSEGQCEYSFVDTKVTNFANSQLKQTEWTQSDLTCAGYNNSKSMVMPTMIKVGNEIHPAVLYLQTCLIFGPKYEGRTLLEIQYKPPVGGTGCV
jgi:hypothetical protein